MTENHLNHGFEIVIEEVLDLSRGEGRRMRGKIFDITEEDRQFFLLPP